MDARRAIADLKELAELTGGPAGARRVCWTEEWRRARSHLERLLERIEGAEVETDAAGNLWATLAGRSPRTVVVGSHLDSVPSGGWLDGALGVFGALEVLREHAGSVPECSVALVDFADEEGARFGRSLLGSSAFAGTLDTARARELVDADGVGLPEAASAHGVDVEIMSRAGEARIGDLAAYLELHIEQGPVLELEGIPCGAVLGCAGVERHRVVFEGRAAHAGSTPMHARADAGLAAARTVVELEAIARRHGGVATAGRIDLEPGIATAVPGRAQLLVDQRHLEPDELAAMLADAEQAWERAADRTGCCVAAQRIWSIEPVPFDERLVAAAEDACREASGTSLRLASGALHDAAEMARLTPTAMIFCASEGGISHSPSEDTDEVDLERGLEALGSVARRVIAGGVI